MSFPESQEPDARPGLFENLRSFWGVLVAILYTRLDLASAEIEETGIFAIRLIILSLAAVLVGIMTVFFFLFFLVVLFWDERVIALSIVLGISVLGTLILGLVVRQMVTGRPKFFAQTLAELRRDVEGLRRAPETSAEPAAAAKATEVKP